MKFIDGGVELTQHDGEITIQTPARTRLKIIYRHTSIEQGYHLHLFLSDGDGGSQLILANQDGFWSTDHTHTADEQLKSYGTFPYHR